MNFDVYLFQSINQFAAKSWWVDALAVFFARYFEFVLILFLFFLLVKDFGKYRKIVFSALAAAILARLVIVEFVRWLWPRPRPFVENHVNLLFDYNSEAASFPSGHAAFYFALAAVICFYNKKAGIAFFAASFFISFARVFSGIHWPFDIVAGAFVGILSAVFINLSFQRFS